MGFVYLFVFGFFICVVLFGSREGVVYLFLVVLFFVCVLFVCLKKKTTTKNK